MATKTKLPKPETVAQRLGWKDTDELIVDLHRIHGLVHAADKKIYVIDDTRQPDIISDLENASAICLARARELKRRLHPALYDPNTRDSIPA